MYSQGGENRILRLFAAGGGVASFSTFERLLLILLCSCVLFNQFLSDKVKRHVSVALSLFLLSAIFISSADYFMTGSLNYGSQKLEFLILSIVISSLLSRSITAILSNWPRTGQGVIGGVVLLAVAMTLTFNNSLVNWIDLARPSLWPSTDLENGPTWQSKVLIEHDRPQDLNDLPITCGVRTTDPNVLSLDYNTYLCTRTLTSLAGLENRGAGTLVEWQLRGDIDKSIDYLKTLPAELRQRDLIILNPSGSIYKIVALNEFLQNSST
jgi:hypothetical protein